MECRFALSDEKLHPSSMGLGNSHSDMAHGTCRWTTQARMGSEDQSSKTHQSPGMLRARSCSAPGGGAPESSGVMRRGRRTALVLQSARKPTMPQNLSDAGAGSIIGPRLRRPVLHSEFSASVHGQSQAFSRARFSPVVLAYLLPLRTNHR